MHCVSRPKETAKFIFELLFVCSLLNSCDKCVAAEVKAALKSVAPELRGFSNNKGAEILLENLSK